MCRLIYFRPEATQQHQTRDGQDARGCTGRSEKNVIREMKTRPIPIVFAITPCMHPCSVKHGTRIYIIIIIIIVERNKII